MNSTSNTFPESTEITDTHPFKEEYPLSFAMCHPPRHTTLRKFSISFVTSNFQCSFFIVLHATLLAANSSFFSRKPNALLDGTSIFIAEQSFLAAECPFTNDSHTKNKCKIDTMQFVYFLRSAE
ncbi:hypothetical protein TNCV_3801091 [Trichonephila clavipes]|nr:hypothetical protein TNCV_3801091 [Trichonephila clavipes]